MMSLYLPLSTFYFALHILWHSLPSLTSKLQSGPMKFKKKVKYKCIQHPDQQLWKIQILYLTKNMIHYAISNQKIIFVDAKEHISTIFNQTLKTHK